MTYRPCIYIYKYIYFGPSLSGMIVTEDANGSNVCKLDILPQYNCQQYFDFVYHTQLKTFTHPIF